MALILLGLVLSSQVTQPRLTFGPIPDGLGVNIHFTDPKPGEMEMLAAAGFTWIRMDFDWNQVEYERGKYRFDAYDRLVAALEKHRIRPLFILDYVHRLYDDAQSPHSDEAIQAFARFAAASARHYAGKGVVWEMYNEPNIFPFWRPKPNVNDYVRLALAVGKAIREAAPNEVYVGPATSGIDFRFLEACFKAGCLEYWDAVTVHPYRQSPPETVVPEYLRLRDLIRKYAPRGKQVPILSGEWGYSAVWSGMDPSKQGKMLPRQWLVNIAMDVPVSIWYDWHDDGPDPKEPEHHFGTVEHPYEADRTPVYKPKPAYIAAQTLTRFLNGFRFSKRIHVGDDSHWVLLFQKGQDVRLAAWSIAPGGAEVLIPASPGTFDGVDHQGALVTGLRAQGQGLRIKLTDAPIFLKPTSPNPVLSVAAQWERLPLDTPVLHRSQVAIRAAVRNTLSRPVKIGDGASSFVLQPRQRRSVSRTVTVERSAHPQRASLSIRIDNAAPLVQTTQIVVTNPLSLSIRAPLGDKLSIVVESPSGESFRGQLVVDFKAGGKASQERLPIAVQNDPVTADVRLPATYESHQMTVGARLLDTAGRLVLKFKPVRFRRVLDVQGAPSSGSLRVVPDGDPRVASEQALELAEPPDGPPAKGLPVLRLRYRYDNGWKFVRVVAPPQADTRIEGKPAALALWIFGDGRGNIPRLRFTDSTGQTFQPDGDPIDWKGWRYVVYPMDGTRAGRWGGAGDGIIHYPIRWDSYFLLDSAGGRATEGEVYFTSPTLIYETEEPTR